MKKSVTKMDECVSAVNGDSDGKYLQRDAFSNTKRIGFAGIRRLPATYGKNAVDV